MNRSGSIHTVHKATYILLWVISISVIIIVICTVVVVVCVVCGVGVCYGDNGVGLPIIIVLSIRLH